MPLPIAHPAAVLPLRRFCPKHLSFSALIAGSVAPDFGYAAADLNSYVDTVKFIFGDLAANFESIKADWEWDDLTHDFLGSIFFCIPVGLLVLGLFNALRGSLIETLPNPHRDALRPLCGRKHTVLATALSLFIGIWLHIGWDSLTNKGRWLSHHLPSLHFHLFNIGTTNVEIFRVMWMISSIGGTVALAVAYLGFLNRAKTNPQTPYQDDRKRFVLWGMAVFLPTLVAGVITLFQEGFGLSLAGIYHFLHRFVANYLICFVAGVAFLSFVAKRRLLAVQDSA
ncbi:MAG: DUF4184 family protein [Nibricoccus sp.]